MRYDELAANAKPDRIVRDRPRHSGLRPVPGSDAAHNGAAE
jgi:hypothetical protein